MKFIKFILSKGKEITIPEAKALAILNDPSQQIFKINDEQGNWTGKTINKAFIIATEPDLDAERDWQRDNIQKLSTPKEIISQEELKRIQEEKKKIGEMMRNF